LAERNEGVDWKSLSHAVRVGREAMEFLATGWITFPLPYADHILAIKRGLVPYSDVAAEIETLLTSVEDAQAKSCLPEAPDQDYMDDLVCRAYGGQVTRRFQDQAARARDALNMVPEQVSPKATKAEVSLLLKANAIAYAVLAEDVDPPSHRGEAVEPYRGPLEVPEEGVES
jgi:hypothetical protein